MARNVEFDILARDRASATFDHVGKSSDGLGVRLGKFGKFAGLAIGGAAVALAGFGAAGVTMGIKTAASNEQASIAFTTMLGSAKKASSFLRDLQAFAASTPFEFPELQSAASSLISAGINANKVIPIMRTLGDVTSGMGTGSEGVQRATIALQQMNAAGKITGEDLNQLRDAGIPVYDLLSKAIGKSKAEVVNLAQKGKLGKDALDKMMKALENGKGLERFSGLMDKQSKSLSGLWSTFKDTLNMGLAKAIEPLIPLLKDGLGKASAFLAAVLPKVATGLQWIVKAVGGLFSLLVKGDFTKMFREAFHVEEDSKLVDFLFRLRDGFIAVVGFVRGKVIPAVQAFGGWLKNDLWPAIQKGYQTIMPALKQALAIVKSALGDTGKGGDNFGKVIKAIGHFIVDYLVPILATLISKWLPIVAHQMQVCIVAVRLLWKALEVLAGVVANVAKFMLRKFADVADMFSILLQALSHVPGFGWAADAAKKLRGMADKARDAARAIDNIQRNVTVGVSFHVMTGRIKVGNQQINVGMRAAGGPIDAGSPYIVGERGPEMIVPKHSGTVIPAGKTAAMRAAGGDIHIGTIVLGPGSTREQALAFIRELKAIKRQQGVDLGLA